MPAKFRQNLKTNIHGAAMVELSIIVGVLVLFVAGVTDIALSIVARQQINSIATVATFFAVQRGSLSISTIDSDVRTAVLSSTPSVIPNPIFGLNTIVITTTTYCGCYADNKLNDGVCTTPTPVCSDNFSGTSPTLPMSNAWSTVDQAGVNGATYSMNAGLYVKVQVTGQYNVIFPYFWSIFTTLNSQNQYPITMNSYVRIS